MTAGDDQRELDLLRARAAIPVRAAIASIALAALGDELFDGDTPLAITDVLRAELGVDLEALATLGAALLVLGRLEDLAMEPGAVPPAGPVRPTLAVVPDWLDEAGDAGGEVPY